MVAKFWNNCNFDCIFLPAGHRLPNLVELFWGDQCLVNLEEIWPLGLERWWRARKVTMIGNTKKCSSVSVVDATAALHLFPRRSIWKYVPWRFSHFRMWDFHPHSKLSLKSSVLLGTRSEGKNMLWASGRTFPFLEHEGTLNVSVPVLQGWGWQTIFSEEPGILAEEAQPAYPNSCSYNSKLELFKKQKEPEEPGQCFTGCYLYTGDVLKQNITSWRILCTKHQNWDWECFERVQKSLAGERMYGEPGRRKDVPAPSACVRRKENFL